MNDDVKPDYTTMSGAEFKRAVGADPEKWAEAFIQRGHMPVFIRANMVAWFRDAMEAAVKHAVAPRWKEQYSDADLEAAVKAAEPPSVDWDKLRDRLNVTLSEHGLPNLHKPSD